jgi:hypothetical protein
MRPLRIANAVLAGVMAMVGVLLARGIVILFDLARGGAPSAELLRVAAAGLVLVAMEIALLAALRSRPPLRMNLALAAASCVVALYAAELATVLREPGWRRARQKLALIEELRASGRDPYPGVEPVRFLPRAGDAGPDSVLVDGVATLPLAGISRRTTVDCKEAGDWLVFESDEHGFHNPRGLWTPGAVDLAFVGDSFVHGNCVPSDANLVAWARRRVPASLNLGTAGSGPFVMLASVREYLTYVRPRTVVWCHFSGNDLFDLRRERRSAILARYLEPAFAQGLLDRQPEVDEALQHFSQRFMMPLLERRARPRVEWRRLFTLGTVRSWAGLAFADPYRLVPTEEEYALFARILREARRTTESWGGRLVFAYLPAWNDPPRQMGEPEYLRLKAAVGTRTRSLVRGLGITVIDVEERFAREPDPLALYACPGCHYGPHGYEVAAETILDALSGEPR